MTEYGSPEECILKLILIRPEAENCYVIPNVNGEYGFNHCIFEVAKIQEHEGVCGYIIDGEEPYTEELCIAAVQEITGGGE